MRRIVLPQPPVADDPQFQRAAADWMRRVKGLIEDASRINDSPMGQAFHATTFTTNTSISGTSTGTDVANFVASLVQALTDRGLVSPTASRSGG